MEQEITAENIGRENVIKHPTTGEWVTVKDSQLYGKSSERKENDSPIARDYTGVYLTFESGDPVELRFEDTVIRRNA